MPNNLENPQDSFYALINQEGQYSLWPVYNSIPEGWEPQCGPASKETCLAYVNQMWIDMRPLSLKRYKQIKQENES